MAYRFNNGIGAITCDVCNVVFDEDISYAEAQEIYGEPPHYCWRHADGKKLKKDVAPSTEKV